MQWKTWKSLEYTIGTWKSWKIGRESQKPGISEIIPGKTNEFAWKKAVNEVGFFHTGNFLATCNFFFRLI